jgi:hypothetical protein
MQKGLAFAGQQSATVRVLAGVVASPGILPRWRCRHGGASVVTAPDASGVGGEAAKKPEGIASLRSEYRAERTFCNRRHTFPEGPGTCGASKS